jgi:hypothetical protein
MQNHAAPLGARVLWLQPPPLTSAEAQRVAKEYGLVLFEGSDIAAVARKLGST